MSCPRISLLWLLVRWRKKKTLPPRSASGRLQGNEYPPAKQLSRTTLPSSRRRFSPPRRRRLRDEARHREHARSHQNSAARRNVRLPHHRAGNSPSGSSRRYHHHRCRRCVPASRGAAENKAVHGGGRAWAAVSCQRGIPRGMASPALLALLSRAGRLLAPINDALSRIGGGVEQQLCGERRRRQSTPAGQQTERRHTSAGRTLLAPFRVDGARSLLRVRSHRGISAYSFRPTKTR